MHARSEALQLLIWPHGYGLLVAGLILTNIPPQVGGDPPIEDLGLCDPPTCLP